MRTTHPRDRDTIGEWTEAHGTKDQVAQLLAGLASLPTGRGLRLVAQLAGSVRAGPDPPPSDLRLLLDTEVGEQRRPPKKLAQVDLEGLRQRMAASIERAQAADPAGCAAKSPNSRRACSSGRSRRPSWSRSPCSTTQT